MSVCVFGSLNLDRVVRVAALPRAGETVAAQASFDAPGGKGANQAVAAARAGAVTRMFGAVGDDASGAALRDRLQVEGVDVHGVSVVPGAATGTAFVTVSAEGENHIVVAANANASAAAPGPASLASCRVALAQLETPIAAVTAFFEAAAAVGAIRLLNAAPAAIEARTLFDAADILILNEIELATFLGEDGAVVDPSAARRLLGRPGQRAVVTLGVRGAAMIDAFSAIHVEARHVAEVVDTTGAGDAFCGTLAAMIAEEADWHVILTAANAAAAACVQRGGAI